MKKRGNAPLNVLFLGSTSGTSTSVFYYTNLLKLGATVFPYDPDPFSGRSVFHRAYFKLTHQPPPSLVKRQADHILSLVRSNPFDFVFVMSQNYIDAETIREMRRVARNPLTIVYHSHDNNFCPGVLTPRDFNHAIVEYDHVFTTKSQNVARYQALGQQNAYYIPSAFDPGVHRPILGRDSRYHENPFDVTFVGTYDKSREPMIQAIGWDRLHVWGSDWKHYSRFESHHERITASAVYYHDYADIISNSKVSLGLLREEAEDLHTQRTFEIPACGALQIAPRNQEISLYFKEDKEIVLFETNDELKEKVNFYLTHPKERQSIAKKGYERVLRDGHTYLDRTREILKISLASKKNSKKAA